MPADPYQVLGVSPDASPEAVHDAYLALVRRYHPDLHPGDRGAEERLKALNAAYEILSDQAERANYDRSRRLTTPPPPRHRPPPRPAARGAYRSPPPHRSATWRSDPDRLRRRSAAEDDERAGPRTVLGRPVADEDARRRWGTVAVCVFIVLLLGCCRLCADIGQSQGFLTRRATVTPAVTPTATPQRSAAVSTAVPPDP